MHSECAVNMDAGNAFVQQSAQALVKRVPYTTFILLYSCRGCVCAKMRFGAGKVIAEMREVIRFEVRWVYDFGMRGSSIVSE